MDYSSSIQIESITSNYEAPEVLEVVPDIAINLQQNNQTQGNSEGPAILASLGLAPKGAVRKVKNSCLLSKTKNN